MSKAVKPEAPQKVDYNDAVAESKKYFDGDDLAATVWVSKYALKDSFGNIYETSPRQMHERIAAEIERIERKYPNPMSREEVFGLLDHFRYVIPQGGPMTGIGNNFQVASLSNCFVIGHKHPADSYGGIFRMDEEQVQLMKRRGGVGHDLSHIRPTGSPVLNSALTSTGIVPFMERYSNSTREVAQDGRRGALMLSLSIKHPDAERFIDAKVDTGKVTGANVSIKIDDEFMRAAIAGKKYHQQFPINSDNPRYEQDIDARKLWDKIIHNAWKSAEPGVLFWDTIIRESVPDCYADEGFVTVSTNPCGEIPLCPYDSCRLLALNLLSYVDNPFKKDAKFNFDKFRSHVAMAMRMMDDIIDLELEKVEQIIEKIAADPEDEDVRRVELELWKKIRTMAQKAPKDWIFYQIFMFVDHSKYQVYMNNMRQLLSDNFSIADIVVFNRCEKNKVDKKTLRRSIKALNPKIDMMFEYTDGSIEQGFQGDDEMPYDLNADPIEIIHDDFGLWYIDVMSNTERYLNRNVRVRGMVFRASNVPKGYFVISRRAMTCCANDIQVVGILVKAPNAADFKDGAWVEVTGRIIAEKQSAYKGEGPVLNAAEIKETEAAPSELVYFS